MIPPGRGDSILPSRNGAKPRAFTQQTRSEQMRLEAIDPPGADEYGVFYAPYVVRLQGRDALGVLRRQNSALRAGCEGMTDTEALHRYAPGKWSVKEALGHIADAERVFSYRLLRISRGDETPLSGFDEKAFAAAAESERRPLASLLEDFQAVRASTLRLIDSVPGSEWTRRGVAAGSPVTARGLVYIMAGHVEHHFAILRERYDVAVPA